MYSVREEKAAPAEGFHGRINCMLSHSHARAPSSRCRFPSAAGLRRRGEEHCQASRECLSE